VIGAGPGLQPRHRAKHRARLAPRPPPLMRCQRCPMTEAIDGDDEQVPRPWRLNQQAIAEVELAYSY